ncbi:MAG: glycoside hydrolase family 65 protein [Natronospirillum sp.]
MSRHPSLDSSRLGEHPWQITETGISPEHCGLNASLFAQANGFIGVRGTLEEGLAGHEQAAGCYLNGIYSSEPIAYGESAYGFARNNESIASAPNPSQVQVLIDDVPVDFTQGELLASERTLAFDTGVLTRRTLWRSPAGKTLEINTQRLVSLRERRLVMLSYSVTAVDFSGTVSLVSLLSSLPPVLGKTDDPRVGAGVKVEDIQPVSSAANERRAHLVYRLRSTGFYISAAAAYSLVAPNTPRCSAIESEHQAGVRFNIDLQAGERAELTKHVVYAAGREDNLATPESSLLPELQRCSTWPFAEAVTAQKAIMDEFWATSDITIGGNAALQQGMRFNLFHLFQSLGRDGFNNIAAKGLTGHGYDGHYFWDTEIYILPFFLFTQPDLAKNLLQYRYNLLDAARRRARDLAIDKGCLFPWRTIGGEECSAYYPAGTAQYHINADVAYAVKQYHQATGDHDFMRDAGVEVVLESARMWMSIGFFNVRMDNQFCINEVTGPDEYTACVNNNFFTNAMARTHLHYAFELTVWMQEQYPAAWSELRQRLELEANEPTLWQQAAERMYLPVDEATGIHMQDDSFFNKKRWDIAQTPADKFPLLLHYHPLVIYRHQVCKQADTVLAMLLLSDQFTLEQKKRNFDYYEGITTHDSTLSACIHSIIANEVGYADKALHYFSDVTRMDLDNNHGNTQHGIHTACMGGAWMCVVQGFAGMRVRHGLLHFAPSLPAGMTDCTFHLNYQGALLKVEIDTRQARYELVKGDKLVFSQGDLSQTLTAENPIVTLALAA